MPLGFSNNWPPTEPTSVQQTVPAYAYVQYQNDDEITAFFDAFNLWAQGYVNWFNALDLPIYTKDPVSGALLDWVGQGIYGIIRPGLPTSIGTPPQGPVNSFAVNSLPANGYRPGVPSTYTATTDDSYRRCITWAFYKGDGKTFSPTWLKRRINRFLNGVNGTDVPNDTTFGVSVYPTGFKAWTIKLPTTTASQIFRAAVEVGAIELPFMITWAVVLT